MDIGYQHILAVISNAALGVTVQMFLWHSGLISFGYIPRSGIVGSHDSFILNFCGSSILFSIVAIPVYFPTSRVQGVPFSPRPHQHVFFLVLLTVTILTSVKWCLLVVFTCISLMICDVLNTFSYTCWLFEYLFGKSLAHFKISFF